jgi:drug/metabolite transporter (DMT)-like permease
MGFFLASLSCVFATAKDLLSKRLAGQLDGTVSTFASFAFALPFYVLVLAVLYLLGEESFEYSLVFFGLVLLRAVTDTFAEGMKMYALAYGDLSLVACFFSLSPLFLLALSPLITGDPLTWIDAVAVVLVVAGSLLTVYRPTTSDWTSQKKGIFLALGASLFFALNSCFDRRAVQEGTSTFAGFTMTLCSALFLLPLVAFRPDRRQALRVYWLDFALRGLLEISFMVSKLTALKSLSAPNVVAIQRLSLVMSIIAGRVFFKEKDFGKRLAAGCLILAGIVLIVLAN